MRGQMAQMTLRRASINAVRVWAVALLLATNVAMAQQTPLFGTALPIPGTWEAEDFDVGGEGIAYHDNVAGNTGELYRTSENVDIIVSADSTGGGYVVNNFETGEWLEYTISVPTSGFYNVEIRASNQNWTPAPKFRIEIIGKGDITGETTVPSTGSWSVFQWVAANGAYLNAGTQILRLTVVQQYFDLNSIRISGAPNPSPFTGTPIPIPGTWEAEDFDLGGEGVAYHDNTPGNAGTQYRPNEDVDIVASTDSEGGAYVVNNFETGEWMVYTIHAASTGLYDVAVRASNNNWNPPPTFSIEIDGVNVTGSVVVPTTGSWDAFTWVTFSGVSLTVGQHVVKIVSDQQYFNLNRIRLTSTPGQPSSLLFWSRYESATTLGPPTDCSGSQCWQYLSGTDSTTGDAWPSPVWPDGSVGRFQLLADAPVDPVAVSTYMVNQLESGTGRNGSQSLYSEIKRSGCCGTDPQLGGATQNPYVAEPSGTGNDLYLSYWLKFQDDLETLMGQCDPVAPDHLNIGRQWRMVFEWKTRGDYRVILQVQRDRDATSCAFTGPLYWAVAGDNDANCENYYEPGSLCPPPTSHWTAPTTSVGVPINEWFKVEVFWHRSGGSDGRVWMAINGQVIADRWGPNLGSGLPNGDSPAQINRIMINQIYTSSHYPVFQWVDDVQIWQGFPTASSGDPWYDAPYAPH